jgi:hypothetical protein
MFTPRSFPLNCESCFDALPVSRLIYVEGKRAADGVGEYLCAECKADHDAKVAAERASHFQALSAEWFEGKSPLALERKSCGYEDLPVSRSLGDY